MQCCGFSGHTESLLVALPCAEHAINAALRSRVRSFRFALLVAQFVQYGVLASLCLRSSSIGFCFAFLLASSCRRSLKKHPCSAVVCSPRDLSFCARSLSLSQTRFAPCVNAGLNISARSRNFASLYHLLLRVYCALIYLGLADSRLASRENFRFFLRSVCLLRLRPHYHLVRIVHLRASSFDAGK